MNSDNFPAVPDSGGDLAPLSPSSPLAPSPAADSFGSPDYWIDPAGDRPTSKPHVVGGYFGVPFEGVSLRDFQEKFVWPVSRLFKQEMHHRGVDYEHVKLAADWFERNCQRVPHPENKYHEYNLAGFDIQPEDRAPLTAFLNHLDDHNVPENTVRLFLSWYWKKLPAIVEEWARQSQAPARNASYSMLDDLTAGEYEIVARRCDSDRAAAESQLQEMYGSHYSEVVRTVKRFIKTLPQADQDFLEFAVAKNGQLMANDAGVITELYKMATGVNAPSKDINAEIAAIEKLLREDRKKYNDSPEIQARYLELLKMRGD